MSHYRTKLSQSFWTNFWGRSLDAGSDQVSRTNGSAHQAKSRIRPEEERYQNAPLIVTSEVQPLGCVRLSEKPVITEAIVDHVIHPCQKITLRRRTPLRGKKGRKGITIEKEQRITAERLCRIAPIQVAPFVENGQPGQSMQVSTITISRKNLRLFLMVTLAATKKTAVRKQ